jgi:hypothetical protein
MAHGHLDLDPANDDQRVHKDTSPPFGSLFTHGRPEQLPDPIESV